MPVSKKLTTLVLEVVPFWYPPEVPAFLASRDDKLRAVMEQIGTVSRETVPELFPVLAWGIIAKNKGADLAGKILVALIELLGGTRPELFIKLPLIMLEISKPHTPGFSASDIKASDIHASFGNASGVNASNINVANLDVPSAPKESIRILPTKKLECLKTLSQAEIMLLGELAQAVLTRLPPRETLERLDGPLLQAKLAELPGVGSHLAGLAMIFSLNRIDVFCLEDPELLEGIKLVHARKTLSTLFLERLKTKLSPFASVASLYYWEVAHRAHEVQEDERSLEGQGSKGIKGCKGNQGCNGSKGLKRKKSIKLSERSLDSNQSAMLSGESFLRNLKAGYLGRRTRKL